MSTFSLRDLLLAVALISIGLGLLVFALRYEVDSERDMYILALTWCGSGGLIGAGGLLPFKLTKLGLLIGIVVQLVTFMLYQL